MRARATLAAAISIACAGCSREMMWIEFENRSGEAIVMQIARDAGFRDLDFDSEIP